MSQPSFQDWLNREPAGPKPKKPLKRTRVARVSKRRRRDGAVYSAKRPNHPGGGVRRPLHWPRAVDPSCPGEAGPAALRPAVLPDLV